MNCEKAFLFSSRRRHTRYWRDWSSDVCSSDLHHSGSEPRAAPDLHPVGAVPRCSQHRPYVVEVGDVCREEPGEAEVSDRKSVVEGKSVDLGGRRIIKKNSYQLTSYRQLTASSR